MKKITRENFEGLRQRYPVLNKEEMRRYVGGNFSPYDENEWLLANPYAAEMNSMDNSSATVSDEEAEEMENDLWGTEADMGLFSMSGYGYGGYGGDIDGGELDEVVIYGNQYGNDSYYYGNSGDSDSDDWWDDDYSGYGSSYGGYGDIGYNGEGLISVNDGQCIVGAIVNAATLLGIDNITEKGITSDLSKYWNANINRYEISNNQLTNILNNYFDVRIATNRTSINNHINMGYPVLTRIIVKSDTIGNTTYEQVHDIIITDLIYQDGIGYYKYFDSVAGKYDYKQPGQLPLKSDYFYLLNR